MQYLYLVGFKPTLVILLSNCHVKEKYHGNDEHYFHISIPLCTNHSISIVSIPQLYISNASINIVVSYCCKLMSAFLQKANCIRNYFKLLTLDNKEFWLICLPLVSVGA